MTEAFIRPPKLMLAYRINEGTFPVVIAFRTEALKRGHEFGEVQNQLTTETAAV